MSAAHLPSLSSLVLGCGDRSLLTFECGSWDPKLFAPQGRLLMESIPMAMAQWSSPQPGRDEQVFLPLTRP